jgi:hypothetical protein
MLTKAQRLILFAILAAPDGGALQKDLRPTLSKQDRDGLVKAGLLSATKRGRGLWLEVTDQGWRWAEAHLDAELPEGAAVLQAWLGRLKAYIVAQDLRLADVLAAPQTRRAPDLRAAYLAVTGGALNQRVRLADLRARLGAGDRPAFDEALGEAHGRDGLHLSSSDNPPELTDADRAAALVYKGEPMHFVWITR